MDDQPLRRSLRVAGMTPLKPMNTIVQSEQQQRGRARSRSSTPRKRQPAPPPDSRARQALNLPSDISSSDFIGDTPTARFYFGRNPRPPTETSEASTVVARRINPAALGPQTVKARKVNRQSSNVFLSQEEETGMLNVAGLSLFRTFGWVSSSLRLGGLWLLTLPILIYQNFNRKDASKWAFILASAVAVGVLLYSLLQLDLRISRSPPEGSGGGIPKRWARPSRGGERSEGAAVPDTAGLMGGAEGLKRRVQEIEASVNEAKAIFLGSDESIRTNLHTVDTTIKELSEREGKLETQLTQLTRTVEEALASKSAGEMRVLRESLSVLEEKLRSAREDIIELKEQVGLEAIRNSIRRELNDLLPEHLVIRRNVDGTLNIDPRLINSLASILSDRKTFNPSDERVASSSSPTATAEATHQLNLKIIENMLGGKVSDLERQIVGREEISELLSKRISSEISKFSLIQRDLRDKLQGDVLSKLGHLQSRVEAQEGLREQIRERLEKSISQAERSRRLPDDVGMADFALESVGSRVVSSGTSPTYSSGSFLGTLFSRTFRAKGPRVALQSDTTIGNCWAFSGTQGRLTIALGSEVVPTHFSLDHLPPLEGIDRASAPQAFSVFGMESLYGGAEAILLGRYRYSLDGPAVQTFAAQVLLTRPLRFIRVEIESNHGRPEYTCLYRFRVHSVEDPNIRSMYDDGQ